MPLPMPEIVTEWLVDPGAASREGIDSDFTICTLVLCP